ncbi:MAG: ferrochelatase [Acidobacteriia bacterium]|nr:ferrochelatase [Terriglobia bacterium]
MPNYDAVLIVSFGGPEKHDDVIPFLENVLRGRNVPRERMLEAAEHYYHFEGRSPINEQARQLAAALRDLLAREGPPMPVYTGNRNWPPMLADTVRRMSADGVRNALAFITSAFSSYSGCRQYLENLEDARAQTGPTAPQIHRLRGFYNHPGYLEPFAESVRAVLRQGWEVVFTAHSIPVFMASTSRYQEQLLDACATVAGLCGNPPWRLVYQSRSGPPGQPWLEPDIRYSVREIAAAGNCPGIVIAPIGFLSDHLEVLWDLDYDAAAVCGEVGLPMRRAATVGAHPRFVGMIRELILERIDPSQSRLSIGDAPLCPDICPVDCCPPPPRRPSA